VKTRWLWMGISGGESIIWETKKKLEEFWTGSVYFPFPYLAFSPDKRKHVNGDIFSLHASTDATFFRVCSSY
jgi:hypothetical protein